MKWHCGLLSDRPDKDRTLQWLKRGSWDRGLPEDVERELRIWMAMPGFSANYHSRAFGLSPYYIALHIGGYDELWREVGENWMSATRDDCIRLCRLRGTGDVPVISQLQMMNDLKAGHKQVEIQREYGVSVAITNVVRKGRIKFRGELPAGFSLLWSPSAG